MSSTLLGMIFAPGIGPGTGAGSGSPASRGGPSPAKAKATTQPSNPRGPRGSQTRKSVGPGSAPGGTTTPGASEGKFARELATTEQVLLVATQTVRQFAGSSTYTNVNSKTMENLCTRLDARLSQPLIALYTQGYTTESEEETEGMQIMTALREMKKQADAVRPPRRGSDKQGDIGARDPSQNDGRRRRGRSRAGLGHGGGCSASC